MDYRADFQSHLDWLVTLWRKGAWRGYAEERARELAAECPALYHRMPRALEEITDRLKIEASARRAASSSPSQESSLEREGPVLASPSAADTLGSTPPRKP